MEKRKRMLLLVVALMVAGLWSSAAWALRPMGPPVAGLEQSQMSVGFDFSWSEMNLETDGGTTDDVESLAYLANLGYGIADNWEAFIRLGIAGVEIDDQDFSGDNQFAYGFGTKVTIAEGDPLTWGGLFQMDWTKSEDEGIEIDAYEIQIAAGPTYQMEGMCLYGGPFLHFVGGEVKDTPGGDIDLKEESIFGGYVGVQFGIAENASCHVEYQITGDASAVGVGIVWRF
jgi:opacity protein-like surface antigen